MLIIEMKFLTGRYNSTPWGRNVNEGVPEWPPSPYRLFRALYDVWKRKCPEISPDRMNDILKILSDELPKFHLPPATASHTRAYLDANDEYPKKPQKIFDAFVVLEKNTPVKFIWENTNPDQQIIDDLDVLLKNLNYFGRSEAWVEAKTEDVKTFSKELNCKPLDEQTKTEDCEIIKVACPCTFDEYKNIPTAYKTTAKVRGQNEEPKESSWLDAFAWSTDDIHKKKLSNPPAMKFIQYLRKRDCFDPQQRQRISYSEETEYNAVLYALDSKVLPKVENTIQVAEKFRKIIMHNNKKLFGEDNILSQFSGKDSNGEPLMHNHKHIFVLPFSDSISGRKTNKKPGEINHILVYSYADFTLEQVRVLSYKNRITYYNDKTPPIYSVPILFSTRDKISEHHFKTNSFKYISTTPFIPTRYWRKSRGDIITWLKNEINRELENHNLEKAIEINPIANDRGHFVIEPYGNKPCFMFKRARKNEKYSTGYSFEITFDEPVPAPFAIGKYAHFGMGMFTPKQ